MRLTSMTVPLSRVRMEETALILSMTTTALAQWNMLSVFAIGNCTSQQQLYILLAYDPRVFTTVCLRAITVLYLERTAFQTRASIMGHVLIGQLIISVFAVRNTRENSVRHCTK